MLVAGDVLLFLALFTRGAPSRRATLCLAAALLAGGLALFLPTLRTARRAWPPGAAVAPAALGAALHVYENARLVSGGFSLGWLLWGMAPYALCLIASAFVATRRGGERGRRGRARLRPVDPPRGARGSHGIRLGAHPDLSGRS